MQAVYRIGDYCEKETLVVLTSQWIVEKNIPYELENMGISSHQKIWWRCDKGHEWQTTLKDRIRKNCDCPYCTNRKVLRNFNDLQTTHPEVAASWHPYKNTDLTPEQVTAGSDKKVWWQCQLGHEWKATVENRALKENSCPYCSGKKAWPGFNDLETLFPDVASEWHPYLNKTLKPNMVRPGSGKKVWWQCANGHSWEAFIYSRTSKKKPGCPFCAGNAKVSK